MDRQIKISVSYLGLQHRASHLPFVLVNQLEGDASTIKFHHQIHDLPKADYQPILSDALLHPDLSLFVKDLAKLVMETPDLVSRVIQKHRIRSDELGSWIVVLIESGYINPTIMAEYDAD